jgi:hypothetical protein
VKIRLDLPAGRRVEALAADVPQRHDTLVEGGTYFYVTSVVWRPVNGIYVPHIQLGSTS